MSNKTARRYNIRPSIVLNLDVGYCCEETKKILNLFCRELE